MVSARAPGTTELKLVQAAVRFEEGNYGDAERLARAARDEARQESIREHENLAEALLIQTLLEENQVKEAHTEAFRVAAPPQAPEHALSRLQTKFAELAATSRANGTPSTAEFRALAAEAQRTGYLELELEIRLAAADQMRRFGRASDADLALRRVQSTAAAKGYVRLAERAGVLMESLPRR
jgi:hypothetical protein